MSRPPCAVSSPILPKVTPVSCSARVAEKIGLQKAPSMTTSTNYPAWTPKQQLPVLASLPFERWPEVLQEAENWGLLSPDSEIPRFSRLQPIFPYFLRNYLQAPEQREVRGAVETAFREHYDQLGDMLYQLFN